MPGLTGGPPSVAGESQSSALGSQTHSVETEESRHGSGNPIDDH